jgi:hypothetical protein
MHIFILAGFYILVQDVYSSSWKKNANKLHLSNYIIKDDRSIMNCSKSSKYFEGVFGGKLKRNLQMDSYSN